MYTRIDICDGDHDSWANKLGVLDEYTFDLGSGI